MSFLIDPDENADLYDHILLAGVKSPGVVKISGHDRKVDWDVKNGPGLYGGSTTLKGIPPVEFTCTFYLVNDIAQGLNDFETWDQFLAVVESSVGVSNSGKGKAKALDIYHPDLARNGILSVCKAKVGAPVHDGKGGQSVSITFQEYRPPKKVAVTPVGSIHKQPDPDADLQKQIEALTKQNEQTPFSKGGDFLGLLG